MVLLKITKKAIVQRLFESGCDDDFVLYVLNIEMEELREIKNEIIEVRKRPIHYTKKARKTLKEMFKILLESNNSFSDEELKQIAFKSGMDQEDYDEVKRVFKSEQSKKE